MATVLLRVYSPTQEGVNRLTKWQFYPELVSLDDAVVGVEGQTIYCSSCEEEATKAKFPGCSLVVIHFAHYCLKTGKEMDYQGNVVSKEDSAAKTDQS